MVPNENERAGSAEYTESGARLDSIYACLLCMRHSPVKFRARESGRGGLLAGELNGRYVYLLNTRPYVHQYRLRNVCSALEARARSLSNVTLGCRSLDTRRRPRHFIPRRIHRLVRACICVEVLYIRAGWYCASRSSGVCVNQS